MKTMLQLTCDEVNELQYPVVVEMWKHIESNHTVANTSWNTSYIITRNAGSSSKRRRWLQEFTEAERAKAKEWYTNFYRWYLVTGTPQAVIMSPCTLLWLRNKLIPFFGTL